MFVNGLNFNFLEPQLYMYSVTCTGVARGMECFLQTVTEGLDTERLPGPCFLFTAFEWVVLIKVYCLDKCLIEQSRYLENQGGQDHIRTESSPTPLTLYFQLAIESIIILV